LIRALLVYSSLKSFHYFVQLLVTLPLSLLRRASNQTSWSFSSSLPRLTLWTHWACDKQSWSDDIDKAIC
jgi:hypothetical protein